MQNLTTDSAPTCLLLLLGKLDSDKTITQENNQVQTQIMSPNWIHMKAK